VRAEVLRECPSPAREEQWCHRRFVEIAVQCNVGRRAGNGGGLLDALDLCLNGGFGLLQRAPLR